MNPDTQLPCVVAGPSLQYNCALKDSTLELFQSIKKTTMTAIFKVKNYSDMTAYMNKTHNNDKSSDDEMMTKTRNGQKQFFELTFFQSRGFVDFPTGNLNQRRN